MERPNHLKLAGQGAGNRAGSIAIVVVIHIAVIIGLAIALNQGAIQRKLAEIKATVDTPKEQPKAPPPPPPDLVKPPPPVAIVPDFQVAAAPPPASVTTVARATPPPAAPRISDTVLKGIARTHSQPPYPAISLRLNELGTTLIEVDINTTGSVDDCKIAKSSGSDRLDNAACDYVKRNWRWQPPTSQGQPTAAKSQIRITWDLKDAR